jgi:cob(I)alamin adenosyltransferase
MSEPTEPPRTADKSARQQSDDPRLIVNTGDGRGKSSSAFGIMGRAWARGWQTAVVQFVKGPDWKTGEEALGRHLGISWHTLGDGFTWDSADLDESKAQNLHAWSVAKTLLTSGEHDLVILDEITYLFEWGWLEVEDVLATLASRSRRTHVVVTGRNAPDALIEAADTVTTMENVKHAFDAGIPAKKGLEY